MFYDLVTLSYVLGRQDQKDDVFSNCSGHGYSLVNWRITLTTHILHFISSSTSTFGACVGLFFLAVFHRFALVCFRLKASRSPANALWSTLNLNKLNKYTELEPSPMPMRYPVFLEEGCNDGTFGGICL